MGGAKCGGDEREIWERLFCKIALLNAEVGGKATVLSDSSDNASLRNESFPEWK